MYTQKNIFYWRLQALHGKPFKKIAGREKKNESSGIYNTMEIISMITPTKDHYPRNGKMGDTDHFFRYIM